ncbi:MAG: thioredoxin family protein [Bernardetiaceae bacterium]|nr:thioredoxin family protein [Bernardetiaceae bacterium]
MQIRIYANCFFLFFMLALLSPAVQSQDVEWLSIEEAYTRTQENPRKIFIDVYTDWCGWCRKMDKNTFSDSEIRKLLSGDYYAVKFNAEQKAKVILGDQTFNFLEDQGKRGVHELAAALLNGRMSYPTVVFLDEKFNMIQPLPGYRKPEELHPMLYYFANDLHKKEKWDDFLKNSYQSPF